MMTLLLRKHVRSGETIIEFVSADPGCRRLLELLDRTPKPCAIIGISIRPDPDVVAAFRSRAIPFVLIDEEAEGATTVACDNLAGGLLAGRHLACLGERTAAVVCGRRGVGGGRHAVLRVKGFERALAERGVALADENVLEVIDYTSKSGMAAMIDLLTRRPAIRAIFCAAGDLCAMGMLSVARQEHLQIPEQVAIIGFDDHPMSGICSPPLTTIRQPLERIAAEAFRLAVSEAAATDARSQKVLFEPELILRQSA